MKLEFPPTGVLWLVARGVGGQAGHAEVRGTGVARCRSPLGTSLALRQLLKHPQAFAHLAPSGRHALQATSPTAPQTFQEPSVLSQRPVSFIAPTTVFMSLSVYYQPYAFSRSPVVKRGDFVPQEMFDNIWRHFWLSQQGWERLLVSTGCRPGMWLNILKGTAENDWR